MGEIGKDFLPEDIFAEVEPEFSNNIVRKNDKNVVEDSDNEADINQKKGKNFDKKHISKTSKKLFLLVLLFVFFIMILFAFIDVVSKLSLQNKKELQNNANKENNIDVAKKDDSNSVLKDSDGDGLYDLEESNFNTDQTLYDTDMDLISDGDEVKLYKTNPLNPDSDGDGISDYDEIFIYKTNPLSSDTDSDGYRDMDEINNGYSPINSDKMSDDYIKSIDEQKAIKELKLKIKK